MDGWMDDRMDGWMDGWCKQKLTFSTAGGNKKYKMSNYAPI